MKKTTTLLSTLACLVLSACGTHAGSATSEAEEGYVTGTVLDTRGEPVAGAKVLLESRLFHASYLSGTTGKDGSYRIKAQPGAWDAKASITKTYHEKTYTLNLQPDSTDTFSDEGAVRNFVWNLEGRTPGNNYGYYGGFIQLSLGIDFNGNLEDIALTLTPDGPLIDGSTGKTLHLQLGDHYWVDPYQIEDIPIGRYIVEATMKSSDGERPLKIQNWHTKGDFQPAFQLDFMPKSPLGVDNSASIVIGD